jgi:hypothetical protein
MWTEAWKRLLARPDALGEVARSSLWGLMAQLRRAAEARPEGDDGQRDCLAVADALGDLLTLSPEGGGSARAQASTQRSRLAAFAESFLGDRDVACALGQPDRDIAKVPEARLWPLILTSLLRLDVDTAARWRARAIEAVREAGLVQAAPTRVVPLAPWAPADADGVLGPDLSWRDPDGAVEPIALGIRFDPDAPFDPRFAPAASSAPEIALLARIAASYAALSELDGCLWHAPARSSGVRALSAKERTAYLNRLADGFHAVIAAEARFAAAPDPHNARNLLDLWIDLDESFHSLVPLPVCAESSWWSRTKIAVRGALLGVFERIRAGGVELDLAYRVLKGPYEVINTESASDIRLPGPGPPGQVVACIRVYVESSRGPRPGRVMFIAP